MEGVIAAVPTPVDDKGAPRQGPFVEHGQWVLANGGDGLNILGSTGEANSFSTSARMQVMEWAADAFPKERLMVGTGTPSLDETIALTRHADDLGYAVALVLPPYYYTTVSDEGLIAWYTALHAALGARDIQIYFYNFPLMTGFVIPVSVMAALARAHPKRFAGIKDSSCDLEYCSEILAAVPDMRVFPGSEATLAEGRPAGFAGCISATTNVTCALAAKVWRGEASDGDIAELDRQRQAIAAANLISSVKALVEARSGDALWRRTLPPLMPLTDRDVAELQQRLNP